MKYTSPISKCRQRRAFAFGAPPSGGKEIVVNRSCLKAELRTAAAPGSERDESSVQARPSPFAHRPSSFVIRHSNRGVALVITLIMLSVITFMAVTFLVLSHRERGAVSTTTDQTTAQLTAKTALDRAEAELVTRMMALTNDQCYDLIVSTNFVNALGFDPAAVDSRTNINFDHTIAGGQLTLDQVRKVLTNLLYNPRPPVYVTNRATGAQEFRFYLDLNRNGVYDTNGYLPVFSPDRNNRYYNATNGAMMPTPLAGFTLSNYFVGDPEWIGVLEYPSLPHSANNKFIARYAYIVVPAGKTLDVNYIHNASALDSMANRLPFRRNMGVGSWEINLAAFLADLNTNQWDAVPNSPTYYQYAPLGRLNAAITGRAFQDANAFLNYRYGPNFAGTPWNNLQRFNQLLSPAGVNLFQNDFIDGFGSGPLMTGTRLPVQDQDATNLRRTSGWPGADNLNHYFTTQEFFDPQKTSGGPPPGQVGFTNRLLASGTTDGFTNSSYNRYTYYRMLAQLGTDSAPDQEDKININYANADANGNVVPGAETNAASWSPDQFFNLAADRLLRTNTTIWINADSNSFFRTFGLTNAFGVTQIPIYAPYPWSTNISAYGTFQYPPDTAVNDRTRTNWMLRYTPGVHRLLQMAANIYDSTTNRFALANGTNLLEAPTVWRPIFRRNPGPIATNIFITGYREVSTLGPQATALRSRLLGNAVNTTMVDLDDATSRNQILPLGTPVQSLANELMVAGIPMVVGAKKGLPNFNQFGLQNSVSVTRKLQFHRILGAQSIAWTNQMFNLGITNLFAAQAWNSSSNMVTRPLQMLVAGDVFLALTNDNRPDHSITGPDGLVLNHDYPFSVTTNFTKWSGYLGPTAGGNIPSFVVPLMTNSLFLTNAAFQYDQNRFLSAARPDPINYFPVPHWWLVLKIRLRYMLLDNQTGRILDYANLASTGDPFNIMEQMRLNAPCDGNLPSDKDPDPGSLWCTNRYGNPTSLQTPAGVAIDINRYAPTYGMMNQIEISMGLPRVVGDAVWKGMTIDEKQNSISKFNTRMFGDPSTLVNPEDLNFGTPFNPTRTIYQYVRWDANDPLVHYTIPDLVDQLGGTNFQWDVNDKNPVTKLTSVNPLAGHYRPWNGAPLILGQAGITDPNDRRIAVKDPLVFQSDDWDFPTYKLPNVGWLGRVHRGSPWQTVYLKATDDSADFSKWSGDMNPFDAYYMGRPVNDRLLFDIFDTAMNENATRGRLSVNQTNLAALSAVLSGVIVLSNTSPTTVTNLIIQPAGIYNFANQPPLVRIVNGINNTRFLTVTNQPGGVVSNVFANQVFNHLGDILATPQLTEQSPFLNTVNLSSKTAGGINDEVLERIPQQIMGLLSFSHSPRFVIYAYGQTLHPADHSIYTGAGSYFGLCTNYQVTAETATRAVVRVNGPISGPRVTVEQFNVLPPDR